jgi:hypothetical protein
MRQLICKCKNNFQLTLHLLKYEANCLEKRQLIWEDILLTCLSFSCIASSYREVKNLGSDGFCGRSPEGAAHWRLLCVKSVSWLANFIVSEAVIEISTNNKR